MISGNVSLINSSAIYSGRDEKVKVMKAMPSLTLSSCVLGQYVADYDSQDPYAKKGYQDDPTVRVVINNCYQIF